MNDEFNSHHNIYEPEKKENLPVGDFKSQHYSAENFNSNTGNNGFGSYEQPGAYVPGTPPVPGFPGYEYVPPSPEMAEKQNIRKLGVPIGISFLLITGIMLFWAYILYYLAGIFGFSSLNIYNFISDPAVTQVVQILVSGAALTLPFIIVMKIKGFRISDLVPLEKPKRGTGVAFFLLGVSVCAYANIAVSQAGYIFEQFGIDYKFNYGEDPKGIFGFILSLMATAVVPPLVEEFALRGVVLGALRRFGDSFAIIASAALFGLMHGNFEQMPFAFLLGLVLGYAVVKTGSLWIPCAIHAFTNSISLFYNYALASVPQRIQNISYSLLLSVMLLGGIAGLVLLKEKDDLLGLESAGTVATERQKLKWFFSSPAIVIFIIICAVEAVMFFGSVKLK